MSLLGNIPGGASSKTPYPYNLATSVASMLPVLTIPPEVKAKMLTFSKLYNKPVKPYVEIYDSDFNWLHTYDSFMNRYHEPSININRVQVTRTADQAHSFAIRFHDHKNEVDKSKITNGAWVILKCGRDPTKLKGLMWGRVSNNPFERGKMNPTYFELVGEGTRGIIGDSMIRYSKTAELSDILNGTVNPDDESSFAWRIVEDILTNPEVVMTEDRSIRDRARFDMSAFEHEVTDSISTWDVPPSDGLAPINDLAEITGSYFIIDGDNRPHFTYGNTMHSGIRLKQYIDSEWVAGFDLADKTSYFHGSWTGDKITQKSSGFVNGLVSQSGKLRQPVSFSEGTDGSFNLFNKDLAQQIEVDNKFVDLVVWLTKSGAGSPARTKVHGHIISDNNGLPTGAKIATFDIKLSQIPEGNTPKPFFISNVLQSTGIVTNADKIWFVMYEVGDSDDRTVNLWHNAILDDSSSLKSAVRALPAGRFNDKPKHSSKDGWQLINGGNGPVFAFTALEILDLDFIAIDTLSRKKYGEKEAPFDVPWSNDLLTTVKAMNSALFEASRPKMEYNMAEVFIPWEYYFDPLDIITIEDEMSGHTKGRTVTARISQSTMTWDAAALTDGIHFMEILPAGFWNPVYDILDQNFNPCEA
jgi:hypothetical protein